MVDRRLVGRKLADIDTYLAQLNEYAKVSFKDYNKDWKTQRVVERTLQILIEACIDVANHLISDSGMRMPESYADTFCILAEEKVITRSMAAIMQKIVKFRNLLVHQYDRIDNAIVVSILHKNLKDFERYKNMIIKFISRSS